MASPPQPLRLTATRVAQHFRFRCARQLRWELVPEGARGGDSGVPARNVDPAAGPLVAPRPGMGLLLRAGRRFERRLMRRLLARHGLDAVRAAWRDSSRGDAAPLPYDDVVATLRAPGGARFLVQPTLAVRDLKAFAARHGFDPALVSLRPANPDLVRLRRVDGRLVLDVVDVKWSREPALHHFAQVAFYVLLLEEVCRAEGIDATVDGRRGWVWSRGARWPRPFALPAYRHHVEDFLRRDLPAVAAAGPAEAPWHLSGGCAGCVFQAWCRAEADAGDDLARVAGLTPLGAATLRGKGVGTVAALAKAGFRRDTYAGCHALEAGETVLKARAQALRFGKVFDVEKRTHLMGAAEGVRLLLSAEPDPVSGTVFALGARVEAGRGGEAAVLVSGGGSVRHERAMLRAFLARAVEMVAARGEGRGVHAFVWDRAELEVFRGLVQRHLASAEAQPALAALARVLFPSAEAGGVRGAAAAPGTVLLDAVSELFALPVPYALDLPAVSAALVPAKGAAPWRPAEAFVWPFASQVAFERAHEAWRGNGRAAAARAGIERAVADKLAALDSVVRAVREQASRRATPRLAMDGAGTLPGAGVEPIADPALETLRLFVESEAALERLAVRQLHTLPTRDRARRFECIAGMELESVSEDDARAVFRFDPACREAKFRPGDFALVLTNDDGEMLVETDRQPWKRRRRMVELVGYDLSGEAPRVTLASETGFRALERQGLLDLNRVCVLDRAEADFNTRRVLATLRALAAGAGEAAFVRGVLDGRTPERWLRALDDAPAGAMLDAVSAARGAPVLNAEQRAAWALPFGRAVTVVWGPPGTGKTYLLAWQLLGLAAAARAAGRPLRVLVTAATHRAIANVLVRLSREAAGAGLGGIARIAKMTGRGSESDAELEGLPDVTLLKDEHLPRLLADADAAGEPVVVGGTVWSLWKQMRAVAGVSGEEEDAAAGRAPVAPLFDVVVIDEASQMKVPDALVALSSVRAGGRVIAGGDDRQLAPIVRGRYGTGAADDTLFGSVFAHLARRFGRAGLRESRRMNDALVRYPRDLFYPGLHSAVPDRVVLAGPAPTGDAVDRALWETFFRPEDAALLVTYEGWTAAARNGFEAWLVARLATLARDGLRDPETGAPFAPDRLRAHALAILSPHRAQNAAILSELRRQGWAHDALPVVDTVERMQGNERDLILVSYAVADAEYAEREAEFLLDPHRWNVSITRARAKLIAVVSEAVLRALPRDERVMTASMALKGYPAHFPDPPLPLALPAPDGTTVRATVRRLRR